MCMHYKPLNWIGLYCAKIYKIYYGLGRTLQSTGVVYRGKLVYCSLIKHVQDYVCSTFININPKQAHACLFSFGERVSTNEKKNYNKNEICSPKNFILQTNSKLDVFRNFLISKFCISHLDAPDNNRID